jgi:SAM-dependent methyltransferase
MKKRRALTHVGGESRTEGDEAASKALARALDVPPAPQGEEEGLERAHIHGFHAYPARIHPITAARLIDLAGGHLVLDPFCGSGTVLVEAMIGGLRATGIDLNPIAVRLTRCKTRKREPEHEKALLEAAARVREHADERRKNRAGATRRYGPEDVALFEPHVLLELDGIASAIAKERKDLIRLDLEMCLSAILVKVSRRASDTSARDSTRRIAAGYTAKLFFKKTEELLARSRAFHSLVPPGTPYARVHEGDATRPDHLESATIDAIVTSPPYAATYDYLEHHALRMRWLGLSSKALEAGEMGARRAYEGVEPADAEERWTGELASFFRAARRVLRPGGRLALGVADSGVRGGALRADHIVRTAASRTELEFVARASQKRPHFHSRGQSAFRRQPRAEHAILLSKMS